MLKVEDFGMNHCLLGILVMGQTDRQTDRGTDRGKQTETDGDRQTDGRTDRGRQTETEEH